MSWSFDVPGAEQRDDGHGDDVGSKQRQYDRQGQGGKQKPAHTVQKRDGEEYHRARQRRGKDGQSYFLAAFLRGHLRFFAELQVAKNVLENDHRIVNQARKNQRQSCKNHRIDRTSAEVQSNNSGQRRQRNRQEHCDGRAKTSQENQDHNSGQQQPHASFVEECFDGSLDEQRLVEHQARWQLLGDVGETREYLLDSIYDLNRVGITTLLQNWQINRVLTIHAYDVGLDLVPIFRVAHIGDSDGGLADGLER